jgi:putative nucleotidyltransferase with HDIG domain
VDLVSEFHDKFIKVEPINLYDYKEAIEELLPLEKTIQCTKWHGEGDVLAHTNLVIKEAYQLCREISDPIKKANLYLAALLHDVGKPLTTEVHANGKITAYGHEQMGVHIARDFLKKYFTEFDYFRREEILSLVEFHGQLKQFAKDEASPECYKRLSCSVNTEGVYKLEMADFRGRIAEDRASSPSVLEVFKAKCQEYGVFGKQYTFSGINLSNLAVNAIRWEILRGNLDEYTPSGISKVANLYSEIVPEFILLVGPPASGKTTYRQNMSNFRVICMDDERQRLCGTPNDMSKNAEVFNNCFGVLNKEFKAKTNVCWDATSWTRKARRVLIDAARWHGYSITIVHFDFPLPVLLERNVVREKKVPENVVVGFYKRIESPKIYEYDKLIVVDK